MSELEDNGSPIEDYLAELTRELGAGKEFTPRFINEARDHLLSSAGRHELSGLTRVQAEEAAIRSFGSAAEIAKALRNSGIENDAIGSVRAISAREGSMIEMDVLGIRMLSKDIAGVPEIKDVTETGRELILKEAIGALREARQKETSETDPRQVIGEASGDHWPVVVLSEKEGDRLLTIFIGAFEATAISFALQGVETSRPMTHDFLANLLQSIDGVEPSRVVISGMAKGTYYAILEVQQAGRDVQIDARPSDAIALALRLGLPVFVNEDDEGLAGALVSAA